MTVLTGALLLEVSLAVHVVFLLSDGGLRHAMAGRVPVHRVLPARVTVVIPSHFTAQTKLSHFTSTTPIYMI